MSTSYDTIPSLDTADQSAALQTEKDKIGKVTQNPFLNYLNNATQVLGPVAQEVATQSGNPEGALVIATAVNGTNSNTGTINTLTDPYAAAYNGMSSPYQSMYGGYPSSGVTTTTGNMTTGGTATTTTSNLSYSMGGTSTSGAPGNIQDSIAQMTNNQQEMLALQYQISMESLNAQTVSNIVKTDIDNRMNTIRNMKIA